MSCLQREEENSWRLHPVRESEGAEECHSVERQPATRDEWLAVPVQGV